MFRSEEMVLYNLVMPRESVYEILNEFGYFGMIQFEDQNKDLPERPKAFTAYIKRCGYLETKLKYISEEM